ncbi:hypothetical protein [Flammeovirga yaeyamensis]|nr:hypothetical protein [Flammeovirga yaeyamensis]MBB3696488.1 hypothetical protein [Flammeovirga yaeyamensis]MBB3696491.1 hypothetical protein [Flammeovirga yaeyamensis]NMF33169.1 hypothetical protein [Flammeovirga yaeyamensis]NMF33172.1 hypothetical protein [Flammeovirga yaeyamensis]
MNTLISELTHFLDKEGTINAESKDIEYRFLKLYTKKINSETSDFILSKFNELKIEFTKNKFEFVSEDSNGGSLFKSFLNVQHQNEQIDVIIAYHLSHDRCNIFLGSKHANEKIYLGKSEQLNNFWDQLKKSDREFGYFLPIDLRNLEAYHNQEIDNRNFKIEKNLWFKKLKSIFKF